MSDSSHTENTTIIRRARTQRVRMAPPEPAEKQPAQPDAIFDLMSNISRQLVNTGFKSNPGLAGFTFPRYFQMSFSRAQRSPHDFDYTFETTKTKLFENNFKHHFISNLFVHKDHIDLYAFIKRYTHANVLGIYLMRYYNGEYPVPLDLR